MDAAPDDLPSVLDGTAVAVLNPLGADELYERLPEMNRRADVNAIAATLRSMVSRTGDVAKMDMNEICAITRDLGVLLASLKRHGLEPIEVVPEVEAPMLAMARRTKLVPRETLFHTSVWNPRGPRQRMFTGDRNEEVLLEATRMGAICVERTLLAFLPVLDIPLSAPEFVTSLASISDELVSMVDAVEYTRKNMDPRFFAQVQRPYYEPIRLGGRRYSGAAAAALSIGVVDHLLWASDCKDEEYRAFQDETIQYAKPRWRELYNHTLGQPSIATRLRDEVALAASDDDRLTKACAAVSSMLRALLQFRGRHRVLAQSAYVESVRLYDVGSAGYGIDTLEHVLTLTHRATRIVRSGRDGT